MFTIDKSIAVHNDLLRSHNPLVLPPERFAKLTSGATGRREKRS